MSETKAVPEGKYVDIGDGLKIHYHEVGEGPPVVFNHGSGPGASGYSNFKQNMAYFAEQGFRVIVPDTLGFGYSSKPPDAMYTLDFMVGGLMKLLDAIGVDGCAVVGNSMGGAMSIHMALESPERVKKLVLMAPGGLEAREVYMEMEGIKAMIRAIFGRQGLNRETMRGVFGLQLFDPSQVTEQTISERLQIAGIQPKAVTSNMRIPNLSGRLKGLKVPVFTFWGTDDKFCPVSGAMTIAREVEDARVMILSRCGHWVMVEHTDLFNRMTVDFLRE